MLGEAQRRPHLLFVESHRGPCLHGRGFVPGRARPHGEAAVDGEELPGDEPAQVAREVGDRVADVFYVTNEDGSKVTDQAKLQQLEDTIRAILARLEGRSGS